MVFDRNNNFKLNRSTLGSVFSKFWAGSVTAQNNMSGFKATGIYPFDPQVIREEAFVPSSVTEAPLAAREGNLTPDNSSKESESRIN